MVKNCSHACQIYTFNRGRYFNAIELIGVVSVHVRIYTRGFSLAGMLKVYRDSKSRNKTNSHI